MVAGDEHVIAPVMARAARTAARHGVGAALAESHRLDPWAHPDDALGDLDLERVHEGEGDAVVELRADRLVDDRLAVAQEHRPERHREVDVLVAVDVPDVGALAALEVDRRRSLDELRRALREGLGARAG